MIIYCIENKINGKKYIGQTIYSLQQRIKQHIKSAQKGVNRKLYNAIRKYGIDSFDYYVLCECDSVEDLNIKEAYYIGLYNTYKKGYNMTEGGPANPMNYPELVEKHNQKMKSIQVRQKISNTMKQVIAKNGISQQTRDKISQKLKGNKHYLGKHRPQSANDATAKKLSKSVYCLDLDFNVVAQFDSVKQAATWCCENINNNCHTENCDKIKTSSRQLRFICDLLWVYGVPCVETIETIKNEYFNKEVE